MNFDQPIPSRPLPLPRANTPPQQTPPLQPQQPAEGGVDPAALVAARAAVVARNRQREARAAMVRDVLRVVGVVVLIVGVALVVYLRHRYRVAEERQQAAQEEAARAAQAQERAEMAARLEAQREARRKIEQAEAAEKRRKEAEKKRAAEQRAEEERRVKDNVKRHAAAAARFHGTTLDLISAAPPTDLPAKVTAEAWFSCVVPGGRTGTVLYEVRALPDKDIHVTRLDETGEVADVPLDEFNRQIAKAPFVLAKGTRSYYRPESSKWELRVPVPPAGASLDPSREDFRDMHAFVLKQCGREALLSYEVFFRDVGGAETSILSVPFGGQLSRGDVARGLQQAASERRRGAAGDIQKRLNEGSLVIRRKGSVR